MNLTRPSIFEVQNIDFLQFLSFTIAILEQNNLNLPLPFSLNELNQESHLERALKFHSLIGLCMDFLHPI